MGNIDLTKLCQEHTVDLTKLYQEYVYHLPIRGQLKVQFDISLNFNSYFFSYFFSSSLMFCNDQKGLHLTTASHNMR